MNEEKRSNKQEETPYCIKIVIPLGVLIGIIVVTIIISEYLKFIGW
ncbi:MAG: hypothetical protein ACFE9I_18305 [Candidatus Hermodarchaeota archaeon]